MSSFAAASSSSYGEKTPEYHVFLTSSNPKDYEKTSLWKTLRDAGIKTLEDDHVEEFPMHQIENSSMVVVVFTPEFLHSDQFLKRLVNIRRCQKLMNKRVFPAFHGLSEEQVREQLEGMDQRRLDSWDFDFDLDSGGFAAEAASLLDSAIAARGNIDKSSLAEKIIDKHSRLGSSLTTGRNTISSHVSMLHDELCHELPCQVGLSLRVRELLEIVRWRYILSEGTIIVEIKGVEGVGKTTIVKAIYDRIGANFEGKSFLSIIGNKGKEDLEKQLVSDISETELDEMDASFTDEQIIEVLHRRRVLVVLDDHDDDNDDDDDYAYYGDSKLGHLWKYVKWCGKGSLIFITRRGNFSPPYFFQVFVDISYEMKTLNNEESLELFCLHAFKKSTPINDFWDFSERVIGYCEGLPLLLEVFGSLLHNRTKNEWERIINDMEEVISRGEPFGRLKISCNLLTDVEKDLFFNIACFYLGQNKHHVTQLLRTSRLPVEMGMSVLIERNLVKVINDKLYVHDLLRRIAWTFTPNKPKLKYSNDVFLSFRGDDTRKSFTSHLYNALKQAGIEVYIDEERIERGENISSTLLRAIESSRISIIILSKNYADSSWCLQELEKIMQCYKTAYQDVLPIFFDVRPSDIRKQQNAFGKAWKRLIKRTSSSGMKKLTINFKRALTEVANLSGWDLHNYRTEIELIDEVIETITKKLGDNQGLFVAHHPVGLKSRIQDILQLLQSKSNNVIITGIWGMGGIGKTTITKAIYNQVCQNFEGKCFLANVREVWKQDNGQVYLQEELLSGIFKSRRRALSNVEMGKTALKEMLCKKRILVVLDDVNNEDQLKALCGSQEWFGQGSRIVITTRDEHLLKILRVSHIYTIKELDDNESLELFSWHAFKQQMPEQDFIELSRRVVSYSGGLPLALEILGSYLFDREVVIWESVLEKLWQIPNDQIYEKLKISYDGLSDNTEKEIFLDICCFLVGKDKGHATQILNGCGLHADIGINRLIELGLVRIDNKNKIEMHDLLCDMGREIIREESPEEPEKRTRLWFYDDVLDVLKNEIGTISIKGLTLNMPRNNSLHLSARTFKEMKRLRLLQLDNVQLIGDYDYLSTNLRWLCWHKFPLESMPVNFNLQKVVAIDLKWSNLTKAWEKSLLLEGLKSLNLGHSHYLTETPNFSKIPYLEKLILKDCSCLSIIHPSIGDLKYIIILNLKDCKSLKRLPRSVYNLKSLKTLNLCGCSKIEKLEEDIGKMESLTTLDANQTAIAQVPFSLVHLKSVKYVSLCGYEGLSRDVFPSLVLSWMSPTYRSKSLSRAFQILPSLIRGLSHPSFTRRHGISDTRPSTSQALCQNTLAPIEFHEQVHMERPETLMSSLTIQVGRCNKITDTLPKSISKGWRNKGLHYSQTKESNFNWLVFEHEGSSVSFEVPKVFGHNLKGMALNIIYSSLQGSMASIQFVGIMMKNFTKATMNFYNQEVATTSSMKNGKALHLIWSLEMRWKWKLSLVINILW